MITHVNCFNEQTGAINISVSGGVLPYTFNWVGPSFSATTQNIGPVFAGTYSVTVTDHNGCQTFGGGTVTQPSSLPKYRAVVTDANCFGDCNGKIVASAYDGTPGYSYLWSSGQTTSTITGLCIGTYTLTVTDSKGCLAISSNIVSQPDQIVLTDATPHNITCFGGNDGSICVTPHGGTPGYTYAWSNGMNDGNCISVLIAGTYSVTVTDSHGCTATNSWTLTEPPHVHIQGVVTHVPCFGGNGSIVTTVTVGVPDFTYLWSNGATTKDLDPAAAGTYTVHVWDANMCSDSAVFTITQPDMLIVSLTLTHNHCYTYHEGSITTNVTGGTPAYTYLWSNSETTPNIYNLGAGTYTVTVTDSHGCTTTGVGTITEPEPWRPCISGPTQACQGSTKTYCICPDTQRPGSTYQWTVSGGTITDGCCGLCKTIIWDHCASGKVCVTETRADGCIMTTCIDVYLVPVPTPVITGPITIYPDSTSVYTTTYSPCYLYSWSVIGGNIVAGAGTNTITVLWGECGPCNPGQVKVCVTDQCNGLHEDFESGNFPPTGFTQIITSTSTNFNLPETWSQGDPSTPFIATHAGNGSAYLWWAYATPQDEWLIAHNVKVTGDLNFWSYVMPGTASNGDHYYVKVSTDQGATWTALMDFATMPAYPSVSGFNEWNEPYNINMTAYSGMMVDIAWQAVNPIGVWAVWGLDDITLGGNKIAVNPTGHASTNNYKGDAQLTKASGIYRQTTGTASGFTPSSNYQSPTACCGCATLDINILASPAPKIQGYVKYKNDGVTGGFPTALNGVTVTLWNASGNIVGTTVTGPNFNSMGEPGYYAFNSVPNANYHMTASFNGAFGGNNATDALIVQLNCIGSYPLHGLDSIVADVNGSMTTTALDALYIKLRTVGMITSYPAGDWKFTSPSFALTAPVTLDIQGLCVGDVNDSYIPTGLKSASFLAPVDGGIMTIPVNESFNYNITSNTISKLGAMTLFMNYDQNRFEIEKVITSLEGMKYVIDNGQISLAWSDTKSLSLKSDDPIISLQMKAKQAVTEPTQIFSINPGSEFADPNANRYDNFEVKLSKVMTTSGQNDFNIFNYPNPFQNTTDIVYTLPEQARVKLVLTNMFGQIIRTLVDAEQSAGTYNVNVNPLNDNLKTGVYLYRIEVSGATNSYNKTNKMLFTR